MQLFIYYCCCASVLLLGGFATAIPLDYFYPFGDGSNDIALPPNDDGFTAPILLNAPFPYFGTRQTTVFVSCSYC